ncbi:MAG: hypothetical protein HUU38_21505 [Anaerolineales bacterium]|nr:hypothetical protein [Anaerolineales bacterium]
MSEISKKRGEFGEEVVKNLLSLVGWKSLLTGRDIPCIKPMDHRISNKGRNIHGIDFIFQYESLLFKDTQEFILISSKYNDEYSSNPVSKFKSHLRDIANALECFKKSNLKNQFSAFAKNNKNYTGVIFWIDNGKDNTYDDVVERLADLRIEDDLEFDSIYLVDNRRAGFLFDTINFSNHFFDGKVEFFIPNTGHNDTISTRQTSSSVLPVQYINSSILPFKITQETLEILVLNVIDGFEEDYLRRLISLSHNLTAGWANKIYILFPKFNKDLHGDIVDQIKLEFLDQSFVQKIIVGSFMEDFRNVT